MRKKRPGGPAAPAPRPAVVGIGASAGGVEAVTALFAHLPPDTGLAFVVVQHLAPAHASLLAEILQKTTTMPVAEAVDGDPLAPNRVFVIPPNKELDLADGRLRVLPRRQRPGGPMPVDGFLESLARERHSQAIAVVLSGTGHDGALGCRAIKAEGGIVFAQDPRTTAHAGMPEAVIAAGADRILSPQAIAAELARMSRLPLLTALPAELTAADATLQRVFQILRSATGLDFSQYKQSTIYRRLSRRIVLHKLETVERYVELLKRDPGEVRALHDDLLIHVTQFFREPAVFEALRAKALPKIVKNGGPEDPIRVWVAGCATGEEAYSLAITLLDYLSEVGSVRPVQIFATDVSQASIERARLGLFPEAVLASVPPRLARRYLTKTDRGMQVAKRVRDVCVFARQNLAKDPPFANVDLISCRNVLIYLAPPLQKRVLPILHYALKPTGFLVLGAAEGVGEYSALFSSVDKRHRLFGKKPAAGVARFEGIPRELLVAAPAPRGLPPPPAAWQDSDVQRAADRMLLARFSPAGVIVNRDMDILHFRGRVNRFLEPKSGRASLNLLKMLPETAHLELRSLVRRAARANAPVRGRPVTLRPGGVARRACLEVVPINVPVSGERLYFVIFAEAEPPGDKSSKGSASSRRDALSERRLERELSATREYLQSSVEEQQATNEELKTANEEILSANEELQSTNEELETAKEELQAANEELTTLNEELQNRNGELSHSNNDLVNLFASVHMPIVMVGNDLRIRRFTPLAEKLMNLIPSDVGRPLGDIKPKIPVDDLEEKVHEVIDTVTTREFEVQGSDGHYYLLRLRPYKTTESRIEGAVILLVDIDATKRAALDYQEGSAIASAVLEMISQPVLVLGADLKVRSASRSFLKAFSADASFIGRHVFELPGWAARSELRERIQALVKSGDPFAEVRTEIEGRSWLVSGRRNLTEGRDFTCVLTFADPR